MEVVRRVGLLPNGTNDYIKINLLNSKACIEIKDERPGFNRNDKKNISKIFQQLSAKPDRKESTTRLALSIV